MDIKMKGAPKALYLSVFALTTYSHMSCDSINHKQINMYITKTKRETIYVLITLCLVMHLFMDRSLS